jgi:hypothetical protein
MQSQSFEFDKYKVTLQTDGDGFVCALIQDTSIPKPAFDAATFLADYNVIARIYPSSVVKP